MATGNHISDNYEHIHVYGQILAILGCERHWQGSDPLAYRVRTMREMPNSGHRTKKNSVKSCHPTVANVPKKLISPLNEFYATLATQWRALSAAIFWARSKSTVATNFSFSPRASHSSRPSGPTAASGLRSPPPPPPRRASPALATRECKSHANHVRAYARGQVSLVHRDPFKCEPQTLAACHVAPPWAGGRGCLCRDA